MVATSEGEPDTVSLLALAEELKLELEGIECECVSRLDELDQGLHILKYEVEKDLKQMKKMNKDRQELQNFFNDAAALIRAINKEENRAANESSSKGSVKEKGREETVVVLYCSLLIKPTNTQDKFQNVISNTVTPEFQTSDPVVITGYRSQM